MSETAVQHDAGQGWGVNWRTPATWVRLGLVVIHLSSVLLAVLVITGALVERVLPVEGMVQLATGMVIAVLLWVANVFCIVKISHWAEPVGFDANSVIRKGNGWERLFCLIWIPAFSMGNAILMSKFWSLLSFEVNLRVHVPLAICTALFSIPYLVAMLRGGASNAEPLQSVPPSSLADNGEPQS